MTSCSRPHGSARRGSIHVGDHGEPALPRQSQCAPLFAQTLQRHLTFQRQRRVRRSPSPTSPPVQSPCGYPLRDLTVLTGPARSLRLIMARGLIARDELQ